MIDLAGSARALFAPGKGLLAADESVHTADARLAKYGVTGGGEEMRRKDRELFLDAPGIEQYLSGVILFSETFEEKDEAGKWFPQMLAERGIEPGIKVDEGLEEFPESPKEWITKGLIGLPERFKEFKERGATFAKWRAAFRIEGDQLPSAQALHENAKRLAKYAREAQEYGIVPIVEPEVLLAGTHSLLRSKEVLMEVLQTLFAVLAENAVDNQGLVLKTAMAISGDKNSKKDSPGEVAQATLEALIGCVPKDVAGIVFLSGGQTPDQATDNLAAITKRARELAAPWPLTYSYARALQEEALAVWKGQEENVPAARAAFLARLAKVAQALSL